MQLYYKDAECLKRFFVFVFFNQFPFDLKSFHVIVTFLILNGTRSVIADLLSDLSLQ